MKEYLAKLQLDEHYYGEYGRQWLSNSDIITLLNDPKSFRVPKEPTKAMLIGRYFHTAMLEPEKVNNVEYKSIDASSRNTKKYKDALDENGRMLMMLYYLCMERPIRISYIQRFMEDHGHSVSHSTIIHGYNRAKDMVDEDVDFKNVVNNFKIKDDGEL